MLVLGWVSKVGRLFVGVACLFGVVLHLNLDFDMRYS